MRATVLTCAVRDLVTTVAGASVRGTGTATRPSGASVHLVTGAASASVCFNKLIDEILIVIIIY
jgi:hypothetical protein